MRVHLNRKKKRNLLYSFISRLFHLPIWNKEWKMKFMLDIEWIFNRMCLIHSYEVYNILENPIKAKSLNFLLDKISENSTVIDLGCRRGELTYKIAEKAKHVLGADWDENVITEAKKLYRLDNLEFLSIDVFEFLRQTDTKYDVLILSHILEHLDNPSDLLLKSYEYFNFLYIEVPDFDDTYLNIFRQDFDRDLIYKDSDHIWEFTREEIKSIINKTGYKIRDVEYRFGVQKYWCSKI